MPTAPADAAALSYAILTYLVLIAGLLVWLGVTIRLRRNPPDMAALSVRFHRTPWTLQDLRLATAVVLALFGILILARVGAYWLYPAAYEEDTRGPVVLGNTLLFTSAGIAFVAFRVRQRRLTWEHAFGLRMNGLAGNVLHGVGGYLAAIPLVLASGYAYDAYLRSIDYPVRLQEIAQILRQPGLPAWQTAGIVAVVTVFAPVMEELLFRGIALPVLARHWGILRAALAVSLAFAFIHFHVESIVPLFVISLGFSLVYVLSGSVLAPIVMHAVFNAVNIAGLLLLRHAAPTGG